MAQLVRQLDYLTTDASLSPIRRGFAPGFVKYKKGVTNIIANFILKETVFLLKKMIFHAFSPTSGRRGRDRMIVGFLTTYPINAYHHYRCE